VDDGGARLVVTPPDVRHHNVANAVGGGTALWGMQAWRFHPDDFRMATRYGVPPGSSLADWPIGYDELEPYYARAEWEIGVAGRDDDAWHGRRSRGFPLDPFPTTPVDAWLARGAQARGWSTVSPPLALNTAAYNGRGGCIRCNQCIGFVCPVNAKNGSHNTAVPRALATGNCALVTRAQAARVTTDARGRVDGVEYLVARDGRGIERVRAKARAVVVAAGAVETARLLLLSRSSHHPDGMGNAHGQVGRHLQGHVYPIAMGILPADVPTFNRGPGVSIATTSIAHDNPDVIGGAMLANDFVKTPILFWRSALPPDTPRWGRANKQAMRELYGRVVDIRGPVHEIPSPEARVRLDLSVTDPLGLAVAEVTPTLHPETLRTATFVRREAQEWLKASGAERVWSPAEPGWLSAASHQAGTCRMSVEPRDGVTDPSGRVHGHDNLFVSDGSVHVTNGAFNPALTIFALAFRTGEQVTRSLA
jgi:choline dehydrogenase-like flavoprotein